MKGEWEQCGKGEFSPSVCSTPPPAVSVTYECSVDECCSRSYVAVDDLTWPVFVCCSGQSLRTPDQDGLSAVSWRSLCPTRIPQGLLVGATVVLWSHLIKSRGFKPRGSETRSLEVTRTPHRTGHMGTSHQTSQKATVNKHWVCCCVFALF